MGVKTNAQINTWENNITLYSHALKLDKNNYVAWHNLGNVYGNKGDFDKAIYNYQKRH